MDSIVLQALRKWPNVPSVYGWLSLDRRGNWAIKGERLAHPAMVDFICRNYARDDEGRWFFQNGPQRVFVHLAYTPLVFRAAARAGVLSATAHTGASAKEIRHAWLDEHGALLLESELGVGIVHDQDWPEVLACMAGPGGETLSDAELEQRLGADAKGERAEVSLRTSAGPVPIGAIRSDEVARRFGFEPDPRPAPGEPEC